MCLEHLRTSKKKLVNVIESWSHGSEVFEVFRPDLLNFLRSAPIRGRHRCHPAPRELVLPPKIAGIDPCDDLTWLGKSDQMRKQNEHFDK